MAKTGKRKIRYGLVGRNISYSFSRGYFLKKFEALGLHDHSYENFDLPQIDAFTQLMKTQVDICGLNVTIPYKEAIIPYLDELDANARKVGAVNTIKLEGNSLKGFNTDVYGFRKALEPLLKKHHRRSLIFGTGGASKAVAFVFDELGIAHQSVSRTPTAQQINYKSLTETIMRENPILVNCTPLGTYPNIGDKPPIPYEFIGPEHLLFDLIYNPDKTAFLTEGEIRGATIANGLGMLELQAEKAWEIWTGTNLST
jgi:shikimate dehydrogenase